MKTKMKPREFEEKEKMKVIRSVKEFQKYRKEISGSIGFVPTLGALHEGHLSLVKKSVKENDMTVVSIFLNPLQFDEKHDLESYPHNLKEDLKKLKEFKNLAVFSPSQDDFYSGPYEFFVTEEKLSSLLCGKFRPSFFKEGLFFNAFFLF